MGFALGWLVSWEPEPPLPNSDDFAHEEVAILAGTYDGAFSAGFAVEWSESTSVVTPPGLAGVVTASACFVGATVRTGEQLFDVDDIGRVALFTSLPFYRPLQVGDSGNDVTELRRSLGAGGSGPVFDEQLAAAVQSFNQDIGNQLGGSSFDPATVVYLPMEEVAVADCALSVGHVASGGMEVFSAPAVPKRLVVTAPQDLAPLDGPWLVQIGGDPPVPISRTEEGSFEVSDPGVLQVLNLQSTDDRNGAEPALSARVSLASPIPVAIIPASSLFVSGETTCVVFGTAQQPQAKEVTALEARLGTVQVVATDGSPLTGAAITNAPLLASSLQCPPG